MKRKSKAKTAGKRSFKVFWTDFFRHNCYYILLGILLIAGIALGANMGMDQDHLSFIFSQYISGRTSASAFNEVFVYSFSSISVLLAAAMLLGSSFIGVGLTPLLLLFRGLGIGASMRYILNLYASYGIFVNIFCILPYVLLTSILLIFACKNSIRFSLRLGVSLFRSVAFPDFKNQIRQYLMIFLLCFLSAAAFAALDTVLSLTVIQFFVP